MIQKIKSALIQARKILITSHVNSDGDAIGSQLALYLTLLKLGKEVTLVNCSPVPKPYDFLPRVGDIRVSKEYTGSFDVMVALDCGDLSRLGKLALENSPLIISIDHHKNSHPFGQINWNTDSASATAEMVYQLILEMGTGIDSQIATCIYTGIITDTGSFHYSNTSSKCLQITAKLVEYGADPAWIAQQLFERLPVSTLRLMGLALTSLRLSCRGRVASMTITRQMRETCQAQPWETENFINFARSLEGVEVAVFFQQDEEGKYKVSLRSKGNVDVAAIAAGFGGGGHFHAAGFIVKEEIGQLKARLRDRISQTSLIDGGVCNDEL